MTRCARFFFLYYILAFLFGCVQTNTPMNAVESSPSQTLRVGISTNSPPIAYKQKKEIVGLEPSFAKGLAAFSGKKLQLVELAWEKQIPSLLSGKIDIIMSGMTITKARSYQVQFTNPYMATGQVSLVRSVDVKRFQNGFTDLLSQAVKVGTITGTTGDFLVEKNKAKGARTQYEKSKQAVKALLNKEIDVLVYDLPSNFYYGAINADKGLTPIAIPLTRENLAWAVKPGNQELLQTANNYLQSIKTNGELKQTIEQWVPFYKNL